VGGAANGVKVWDAERMQLAAELPGTNSPWGITADGRGIHTRAWDGVNRWFRLWDVATRAMVSEQSVARQWPAAGMFPFISWFELSPDGRILVVADDRSGAVQFWDALQWRELATRTNHSRTIRHVRFSRDSTRLFSSSEDGTVHLWDMRTLRSVAVLATNSLGLLGMALSPDERTLAVGSQDTRIYLWDWQRRSLLATLKGHRQAVISVAFSPDGKTLASSSSDGTVTLWHVPLRREIAKLRPTIDGEPIEEEVRYVGFSPDGNLLAARTYQGTLMVWRAASWEEIAATEARETPSK
jgi:WD40 repeat protein